MSQVIGRDRFNTEALVSLGFDPVALAEVVIIRRRRGHPVSWPPLLTPTQ
jgi:hypothetical protein